MLATDEWIYLDLEKTGCTFLTQKLKEVCSQAKFVEESQHSIQQRKTSVPKIITIREPVRYYFSLWSFGLDGKGGFFQIMHENNPWLTRDMFGRKSAQCFAVFLDFVLSYPGRYPTYISEWLPPSTDLYTARILEMLIPISEREAFARSLSCNYSHQSISTALAEHIPDVIIRTESLNRDFYKLESKGLLRFLNLNDGWRLAFPEDAAPTNVSTLSRARSNDIHDLMNEYHMRLIEAKCIVANLLRKLASERLGE
jgi:hypothetical protein